MNDKIKVGKWETVFSTVNILYIGLFLNMPASIASNSGNASWIEILYLIIILFIIFRLTAFFMGPFKGKDILEITEYVGGKTIKIVVGLIFISVLLANLSANLRAFGENTKTTILPTTPLSIVEAFYIIAAIIAVYVGIESIMRMHLLFYPLVILGFVVILLAINPFYLLENIYPILGLGPRKLFFESIPSLSVFSNLLIIYVIWSFAPKGTSMTKFGTIGIIGGGIFLTISFVCFVMIFPYPVSSSYYIPFFEMTKYVEYGRFFQGVESLFVFIWILSAMLYLSIVLFACVYIFQRIFNLKYLQPLIMPFSILCFTISFFPSNLLELIQIFVEKVLNYSFVPALILPLIISAVGYVKIRKKQEVGVK